MGRIFGVDCYPCVIFCCKYEVIFWKLFVDFFLADLVYPSLENFVFVEIKPFVSIVNH